MSKVQFQFTVERFDGVPYRVFRGMLGCPAIECKLVGEAIPEDASRKRYKVTVQGTGKRVRRFRDVLICIEAVMGEFSDIAYSRFNVGDKEDRFVEFDIEGDVPDTEGMRSQSKALTQSVMNESLCSEPESDAPNMTCRVDESDSLSETMSPARANARRMADELTADSEDECTQVVKRAAAVIPEPKSKVAKCKSPTSKLEKTVVDESDSLEDSEEESHEIDGEWEMVMSQSILARKGSW